MECKPVLFDLPGNQGITGPVKRWRQAQQLRRERLARPEEQPLKEELYSIDQLDRHARLLAESDEVRPRRNRFGSDRLLSRLGENEKVLEEAYGGVTEAMLRGRRITPAAEWFVDNYHLIEEHIRTARRDLPRGYSQELPELILAYLKGLHGS